MITRKLIGTINCGRDQYTKQHFDVLIASSLESMLFWSHEKDQILELRDVKHEFISVDDETLLQQLTSLLE